jgi:transposase
MGFTQFLFQRESVMAAVRGHRRRSKSPTLIHKPQGAFHPRVQKVGPERFGIISVDCAKARSKWMLCDFYGKIIIPPTVLAHDRSELDKAIVQIRQAITDHDLRDVLVAIERTGSYHRIVQRAFTQAGFEVRIVHPFATKQYRQPSDPGNKTDDTDLTAIHRAAVGGFALVEEPLDQNSRELCLLIRHRRNLVRKTSMLACQIREHLEAVWPGYGANFSNLWQSEVAWELFRQFESTEALVSAGLAGLRTQLRQAQIRCRQDSLERVLNWAKNAPVGEREAALHRCIVLALQEDRQRKSQEIQALERESAARLARTPYVLLLSFPGVNVVSAADFAGEMGPIDRYANSRCITGRAGLYPWRYQSDQVDVSGELVRRGNRRLRAAIMAIADNLMGCNHYFNVRAHHWKALGKDPRHSHVKIALRFCRIAYQMVAGRQIFNHPGMQQRHYILDKLLAFHREHEMPMPQALADVEAAMAYFTPEACQSEARPLAEQLKQIQETRRGPQLLGDILPIVLARLGVGGLQSTASGERPR